MWIKDSKVAIEFHGLVHHSERAIFNTKDIREVKNLHEIKYLYAKREGIKLIQIFEDEWVFKKEIIKSMIKNRLSLNDNKIFARKCEIKEVSAKDRHAFFEITHISGDIKALKSFGLFYENELISALSLRNTWNKSYGNVIEIARFATKLNTNVVGGFQKLLKQAEKWALENKFEAILTYADCRFGSGKVYYNSGFNYKGKTSPNYFYEKDGIRENRFKHRKNLVLEGNTEREQQNKLGWYAIYDAGNEIYLKSLK